MIGQTGRMRDETPRLPPGYRLDVFSHPGLVVLRRRDGSFVAAFSSLSVTKEDIERAAERDREGRPDRGD